MKRLEENDPFYILANHYDDEDSYTPSHQIVGSWKNPTAVIVNHCDSIQMQREAKKNNQ